MLPTIKVSLTRIRVLWILAGLNFFLHRSSENWGLIICSQRGSYLSQFADRDLLRSITRWAESLEVQFGSSWKYRTFALNVIDLEMFAFAARMAARSKREGWSHAPLSERQGRLFDRRLEVWRKRAKRAASDGDFEHEYRLLQVRWQRFLKWATPRASRNFRDFRRRGHYHRVVDHFHKLLLEALSHRKRLPKKQELRRIVCLGLRKVRREGTAFTIKQLLDDAEAARSYFLETFRQQQLKKLNNRKGSHDESR